MPITFNDVDVWTEGDGSYNFNPGMIKRRWMHKPLLRADGEIAKRGGLSGCNHTLVLNFHAVEVADIPVVFQAMDDIARGDEEATLSVPDYGDYPNCVCTDAQASPQTCGLKDISPDLDDLTKAYKMEFTLTFRQSRP